MNTQLTAHAMAAHTNQDILQIEDLSVNFGTDKFTPFCALNGVSLSIKEGEVLGLVGESGSGKTVLSHSIMGLLPREGRVNKGRILWKGKQLQDLPEAKMRQLRGGEIAMIFQDPQASLNPIYPVGKQIEWVLKLHRGLTGSEAKETIFELFKSVQLKDPDRCYCSYAGELSGGMCQRVMIALALSCQPKLLIADEPTSALDVSVASEIVALLADLRTQNQLSMLFVTHDLGVATCLSDRIAVMAQGRIVENIASKSFLEKAEHPSSQSLIRSSRFLSAQLHSPLAC